MEPMKLFSNWQFMTHLRSTTSVIAVYLFCVTLYIHFIRAGILTHLHMAVISVFTSFHQLTIVCIEHYYFTTEITLDMSIMITLLSAICHFASVSYLKT